MRTNSGVLTKVKKIRIKVLTEKVPTEGCGCPEC